MVSTHANEVCREIILRIPKQPGEYPTLDEMLRAVSAVAAAPRMRPQLERRKGGPKVAMVQHGEEDKTPKTPRRAPGDRPCFLCGRKGHWSSQCPKRKDFDDFLKREGGGERNKGPAKQKN